jgi:hypothetical protein
MAQGGYRSGLGYWLGGGGAPPFHGGVRSLLAFWLGGACGYPFIPQPIPVSGPDLTGGLAAARRHPIDDPEVIEFLEWWTLFNDVE